MNRETAWAVIIFAVIIQAVLAAVLDAVLSSFGVNISYLVAYGAVWLALVTLRLLKS